jgi:hypothetical protein
VNLIEHKAEEIIGFYGNREQRAIANPLLEKGD